MSMLVVGSVAFDTIHNADGSFPKIVGGSATYAALSASYYTDVQLVGVVGKDFPDEMVARLRSRGVDVDGLEIADGDTFHWEGRYSDDLSSRETIKTELNVFAEFEPKIPEKFRDASHVMLGNIHPALQLSVLDQVNSPSLVIADTMNFWIEGELPTLKKLVERIDLLVLNEEEGRLLTGEYHLVKIAKALAKMGPRAVIVKQGEYGAYLFVEGQVFNAPAFPLIAKDPTGAGDSFAGGFLGYLAGEKAIDAKSMRRAVVHGSAVASFCVEDIGVRGLELVPKEDVDKRVEAFRDLVSF